MDEPAAWKGVLSSGYDADRLAVEELWCWRGSQVLNSVEEGQCDLWWT